MAQAELVVTELHFHRNGVCGAGYYAGRAEWTPDDKTFHVMFAAFIRPEGEREYEAEGHIAIMDCDDYTISFRFEDFEAGLRKFIFSRGGDVMMYPHLMVRA